MRINEIAWNELVEIADSTFNYSRNVLKIQHLRISVTPIFCLDEVKLSKWKMTMTQWEKSCRSNLKTISFYSFIVLCFVILRRLFNWNALHYSFFVGCKRIILNNSCSFVKLQSELNIQKYPFIFSIELKNSLQFFLSRLNQRINCILMSKNRHHLDCQERLSKKGKICLDTF